MWTDNRLSCICNNIITICFRRDQRMTDISKYTQENIAVNNLLPSKLKQKYESYTKTYNLAKKKKHKRPTALKTKLWMEKYDFIIRHSRI